MNTTVIETRTETPGDCWDCGGPCVAYAGAVHGWRCRRCLAAHVDRSAAAFAALDARKRRRVMMSFSMSNRTDGDGGRRGDGGAGYGPTTNTATTTRAAS